MCGIAGIIGEASGAQALIDAIAHRGPNGIRVEESEKYSLAHARLSIIDLEGGWQPLHAAGSPPPSGPASTTTPSYGA